MKSSVIADAKFQEYNFFFSFEKLEDKLVISLNIDSVEYQTEVLFHPDIDFDDVQDALLSKQFKLLSRTSEAIKIKAGFLNLEFKNTDQKTIHQLKTTIVELRNQLNNQALKNKIFEQTTHQLRTDVDSITTKLAVINLKLDQNETEKITLKQELAKSNQKINELTSTTALLSSQNNQLRHEVDLQKKQLSLLKVKIDQNGKQKTIGSQNDVSHPQSSNLTLNQRFWTFSQKYKAEHFQLLNNFRLIKKTKTSSGNQEKFAFVDGLVIQKGNTIRFKIEKLVDLICIGLAIRNIIIGNKYGIQGYAKPGHGSFLMTNNTFSYSHSSEKNNSVKTDFGFCEGDIIQIITNEVELIFINETHHHQIYKLPIALTENQWKDAYFCVVMHSQENSVLIV